MRLNRPLLRLPRLYCAQTLATEVGALPNSAWIPHPDRIPGNDAVLLVSPGGQMTNGIAGPMGPTPYLLQCPYIMEIMDELGGAWGRSRLMGLAPDRCVPPHIDVHYYWRTHTRIHIPVVTNPGVTFDCGGEQVHMAAGECWIFDSFRPHGVRNDGKSKRIHLVLDVVGGEQLWDLVELGQCEANGRATTRRIAPGSREPVNLAFEQVNVPRIMSPWEIRDHVAFIRGHAVPDARLEIVFRRIERFADGWASIWAGAGDSDQAVPQYQKLIYGLKRDLALLPGAELRLTNGTPVYVALRALVLSFALSRESATDGPRSPSAGAPTPQRMTS